MQHTEVWGLVGVVVLLFVWLSGKCFIFFFFAASDDVQVDVCFSAIQPVCVCVCVFVPVETIYD